MAISSNQLEEHAPLCAQSVPGGKEPQLRYFMEPPVQLISCRGAIPATSMACEEGVSRRVEHMHADCEERVSRCVEHMHAERPYAANGHVP